MSTVNVTIRMDEGLKKQADELFADIGLTLNSAMNIFVKQAVREQRIPFEITRKPIVYLSDEQLDAISDKIIAENLTAYKGLAK